ncbi:MAG: DUF4870 domain-containing protein [Candidatus Thermoplasmatota archaeon]
MAEKTSLGLEENVAGLLSYLIVWVSGIIFYFLEKDNKKVRFHALQSVLTFLPLTILGWIFGALSTPTVTYGTTYGYTVGVTQNMAFVYLSWIVWAITVILWLVLMIKAYQGEKYKLPFIGDIAEKNS